MVQGTSTITFSLTPQKTKDMNKICGLCAIMTLILFIGILTAVGLGQFDRYAHKMLGELLMIVDAMFIIATASTFTSVKS